MKTWIQSSILALLLASVYSKSMRRLMDYEHSNEGSLNATANCNCDWRLLRHYEAKLCQPVEEDECGCPKKYNCPSMNEIENIDKACVYKGREYEAGSRINTTNVCQVCKCLGRKKPRIFCIPIECELPENGDGKCNPIYEKDSCCPVRFECDAPEAEIETEDGLLRAEIETKEPVITCEHEGAHYPLGARIYTADNPCQVCECTEDWNATGLHRCYKEDCVLEKNKAQLDAGCVPIYHENRCCPIEFYCPQDYKHSSHLDESTIAENSSIGSQCIFGANFYDIGQELPINHTTKCVTCTCVIPPDFTCIHQSCPQPSNTDNCISRYSPDHCCPQYDCLLGDSSFDAESDIGKREMNADTLNDENLCNDMRCKEDSKCMLYLVMCGSESCPPVPACLKINNECETSICGEGCVVVEQDHNNCLTCACGENINRSVSTLKCSMPHCVGQNCHLVGGEGGCPVCSCDEPCPVNECPAGCNVLLSEGEGRCPKCICEDETEGCPTPLCADETCRIETPDGGCPTCICDNKLNDATSPSQVQHQQSELEDTLETEGQILRESEEDFDDIRIMTGNTQIGESQPDNELNSETENDQGVRIISNPQPGRRQP